MVVERIVVEGVYKDEMSGALAGANAALVSMLATTKAFGSKAPPHLKAVETALKRVGGAAGSLQDELVSQIDRVISTMGEFGGESDDIANAVVRLGKAGESGKKGLAQAANALRMLVDESEDSTRSLKMLNGTLQLGTRHML